VAEEKSTYLSALWSGRISFLIKGGQVRRRLRDAGPFSYAHADSPRRKTSVQNTSNAQQIIIKINLYNGIDNSVRNTV
jgi:hypothetical protein